MNPIEVSNVSRTFGSFTAVDNVSMSVAKGEVVGLLGANGAGKTTLIKMILGLLEPTSGAIGLFGQRQSPKQRARIGYVPQNLGLYTDLTAAENLEFRAEVFGADSSRHRASADRADINPLGVGLVGAMSLGMQRRVAFAAATQHDPELFILDEPTSGVSPLARSELWDLIRRRAEAGAAVLVSTHYMEEAEQTDRLVVMAHGSVVAEGSAADVIDGQQIVEVETERWSEALEVLERDGRQVSLAGRKVRVLSQSVATVAADLELAGIAAEIDLVPATLDETMVGLNP